jgi:hypothetical protein
MARPKLRGYDRDGRLTVSPDEHVRLFSMIKVKGKWVSVWGHLVLTPPPIKRTEIDWRE